MRDPLRHRPLGLFVASIVAAASPISAGHAAEIYKCIAKDGSALYQNFPCHIDSLGWSPSSSPANLPAVTPTAPKSPRVPIAAVTDKAKPEPVPVAAPVKSASASEPHAGMTSDEVRAMLGEPEEMVQDEPAVGGRVSNWRYADGRIIQFDHRHRVLGVQR